MCCWAAECCAVLQILTTGLTEFSFEEDEGDAGAGAESASEAGEVSFSSGSDFSAFGD
jgi:hypothetical protein